MAKNVKQRRRASHLEVRVRKTRPRQLLGPSPPFWKSPNCLRILFTSHTRRQYLDSSSTLLRVEEDTTGAQTTCVDNRVFFNRNQGELNYDIAISEILESFGVKAYLHERIISQIMSLGQPKYRGGKKVKRKLPNVLRIDLTWIQPFILDRDSVNQLLDEVLAGGRIWRGRTK